MFTSVCQRHVLVASEGLTMENWRFYFLLHAPSFLLRLSDSIFDLLFSRIRIDGSFPRPIIHPLLFTSVIPATFYTVTTTTENYPHLSVALFFEGSHDRWNKSIINTMGVTIVARKMGAISAISSE